MLELGRCHRVGERLEVDALSLRRIDHRLLVGEERDVVLRCYVLGDAVGDVDVLVAVEVKIGEQRTPAPVCAGDTRHLADVAERTIAVIQLEHVAHQLVMKSVAHLGLVGVPALE